MDSLVFENPELNNDSKSEQDQKVEQQDAIDFSNILIALFEDIATDLSDVSVEDLKSVYRRSESSFSCFLIWSSTLGAPKRSRIPSSFELNVIEWNTRMNVTKPNTF